MGIECSSSESCSAESITYSNHLIDRPPNSSISFWCYNSTAAAYTYGNISTWDISIVTTLASLFYSHCSTLSTFNEPLDAWEVSSVTSLNQALYQASVFDQSLASWDVSRVTDMQNFLNRAYAFSQNLVAWDTSKMVNLEAGLYQTNFNHDISPWSLSL